MGSALSLEVPADEQTVETGRRFYEYHVEQSEHLDSVDDHLPYEQFTRRIRERNRFMIYQKIPHSIFEAAPEPLWEVCKEHTEDGYEFTDREGMEALSAWLESARESPTTGKEDLVRANNQTISKCQHMVEFALEHGYSVVYSH
ncbi:hypothetical protein RYH80_12820 [Halobaculum sp. MBLA0147]|uniref:hypothetical protein n=1 Tax=Halobaculum sp. MBLA0147 TaxID=3079934 RepID=UPI003523265B